VTADAEHTVFGLQDDVHASRNVVGDERGHPDAEIDVVAVAQFQGDAAGDAFAFLVVAERHLLILNSFRLAKLLH